MSSSSSLNPYSVASEKLDTALAGRSPSTIVRDTLAVTAGAVLAAELIKNIRKHGFKKAIAGGFLSLLKVIPGSAGVLNAEKAKTLEKMEKMMISKETASEKRVVEIPAEGVPMAELKALLSRWKTREESKWNAGQVSGGIYHGGNELLSFLVEVYGMFALSNPLHPDVFPFIRKMEAEVVAMSIAMFNGDINTCGGTMTSGGTESILMAMKAYRDQAKLEKGIEVPEIIAPITAHAAFDKAAHYFGMKLVHVPVDPITFKADVNAVRKAINRNTVVLVGSCPAFPQGIIDPMEELGQIAQEHGIGLHADCCLGGFLLPFVEKLGYKVPIFDFRVPGVTSISADTHKYGYAPKGSSVVLYRSKALRTYQYFVATGWTGGIYASPAMPGSRPGGLIAATWAALVTMGQKGYLECAKHIMETARQIEAGIRETKGLKVLGVPEMSVVSFTHDSDDAAVGAHINIFKVGEGMSKRGWNLNTLQHPSSIHICCTYLHKGLAPKFLKDLREVVTHVKENPDEYKSGSAAIYGMAESIPDGSIIDDLARGFIDCLYKA